jgi:hypothetical protein
VDPPDPRLHQPRHSIRLDARLDAMTRAKLEDLANQFRPSRAAVLRHVMHKGPRLVSTSWVFVTFGDSGSRKHNCHERGEGGELENPY